jgi:hypothetical protein
LKKAKARSLEAGKDCKAHDKKVKVAAKKVLVAKMKA